MTVQHGRPRKICVRMIKAVVARSQALILLLWLSTASTCHLGRHAVATAEAHATTTSTRAKAPPGALRNRWPHFPWHGISSSRRFAFVGNFGCRHRATRVSTDKNDGVMFLSNKRGGVHRINMVAEEQEPGEEAATTRNTAGRQRRKPRGNHLRKNEAGMPIERVYAPRQSQYGQPVSGGTGRAKRVRSQGQDREVAINNAARLKVAGGMVKGRRLESPDVFLRPMMGKVKEALFNTLNGFGVFETGDARFLDLFSGSGSVGIEALSRGAGHATFVDLAKDCCEVCLRNADICGFDEQVAAVRGDVMDVLYNPRKYGLLRPFDVVTVTPPYEEVVYADLIKAVEQSDLVVQDTIVVIEYPVELGCLPHAMGEGTMVGLRNRRYGRTVLGVWVYLPSGQYGDMVDSRPEEFISLKKK